jgi:hypothetical protein
MLRALPSQNSLEKSTYDKDKEVLPQDEFDYGAEGSLTRSVSTHLRVSIALCICVCSRARTHTRASVRACVHADMDYECVLRAGTWASGTKTHKNSFG